MKFRLVEDFDDLLLEDKAVIEPGSELEQALIDDIEHTDKSYQKLVKEYGLNSDQPIKSLIKRKNLNIDHRKKKYFHVYFNTLAKVDLDKVREGQISCKISFSPSIYIGSYNAVTCSGMVDYIRSKYLDNKINNTKLLEFYLKIAANDISLKAVIEELKSIDGYYHGVKVNNTKYEFITISEQEVATTNFYSFDYSSLSSDILLLLDRSINKTKNSDIISRMSQVASRLAHNENHNSDDINDNIDYVAHNIYSRNGTVVDAGNYIEGVPYEAIFDIQSYTDIEPLMRRYSDYLLYGFIDHEGKVIYVGITVNAKQRGKFYTKEQRPLIIQAFQDNLISKFVIFKSNLPTRTRIQSTRLIYALEGYFAEKIFKTYPAKYPTALNVDKPGKNSSQILASRNRMKFEKYISNHDTLLSFQEFRNVAKDILEIDNPGNIYYYSDYVLDYINTHDKMTIEDKKTLYKSLKSETIHILWDICSSESEYKEIVGFHHWKDSSASSFYRWKNYRIKNNLPITEDLDDDIDMEYYV